MTGVAYWEEGVDWCHCDSLVGCVRLFIELMEGGPERCSRCSNDGGVVSI